MQFSVTNASTHDGKKINDGTSLYLLKSIISRISEIQFKNVAILSQHFEIQTDHIYLSNKARGGMVYSQYTTAKGCS